MYRSVILVAGGTVIAQSIGAAATPLLTRLYGPEALGALAAVIAYAGIVGPVAGLCLPVAIVLAADQQEVADIARASRTFAAIVGIVAAAAAPLFLREVVEAGVPSILTVSVVLVLVVSSVSVQVVQQKIIRGRDFGLLGALSIGQAILFAVAQVAAGIAWPDVRLLVAVSGVYFLLFLLVASSMPRYRQWGDAGPVQTPVLTLTRRFQEFPRYRAPQVLLSAIAIHLPTLLLATLVDIRWAGLFMITHRVLALPILFVGKSISDVIYPQVVSLIREGKSAHALIRRWTVIAALVASPIAVVLLMGGPSIFAWVLGEEWREAGSLAQAMVPWMVGALVSRPAVGAVAAMALQRAYLFYDAIAVAARSLSFLFMLLGGFDVWVCLLTWSIISVLGALWIVRLTLARARVS